MQLAWKRHAEEAGYSVKIPKERTDSAIGEQRVIGWVLAAGAVGFAGWIAWNHRLCIRAEGEWVIGASGQRVELDRIVKIDRKLWDNKGIAYALYEIDGKQSACVSWLSLPAPRPLFWRRSVVSRRARRSAVPEVGRGAVLS